MNKELQILLETLPPDYRPIAEELWGKLPADVRAEMELTFTGFSKLLRHNPGSFNDLLKLAQRNASPALSTSSSIAIVGPVNVGKSTLYNALVKRQEDQSKASPVPGTTRENKKADAGLFQLVDTPGADNGAAVGEEERNTAFQAAREADTLLIVFDASGNVTASDKALYQELLALGKPHLVVLNKIDLVRPSDRRAVIEAAARILGLTVDAVHALSAQSQQGVEKLLLDLTAAEPGLMAKVAEFMPSLRRQLAWQAVRRAAITSAVVALTPIPVIDLLPLTIVQGSLVLSIARIYGEELGPKRIGELMGSFGLGWLGRMLFQEVSKVAGLPGWLVSSSIATSATLTIGYATMTWFETGRRPDKSEVTQYARESQGRLTRLLSRMGRKKPDKKSLTEELEKDLAPDVTIPKETTR